jgi:CheY-like chemotaxis protein
MASILICEADPDVRRLLVVLVERLGHAAVVLDPDAEVPPRADVLLLEPAAQRCIDQAWQVRLFHPALPVVCMGAPGIAGGFLSDGPVTFLEKPFTVDALRAAVASFVASPV